VERLCLRTIDQRGSVTTSSVKVASCEPIERVAPGIVLAGVGSMKQHPVPDLRMDIRVVNGRKTVRPVLTLPSVTAVFNLDALEREVIRFALARNDGNQTRAACFVGLSRSALLYRMQKYGLRTRYASNAEQETGPGGNGDCAIDG
jgi:transcriptional regulator with GAF, ATPase, and Fis domain